MTTKPDTSAAAPQLYQRIGAITRQLHEALRELGYDKSIEASLGHLPDARSRLAYIARVTGDAAEKVLNTVDQAQATQARLATAAARIEDDLRAGTPPSGAALLAFAGDVRQSAEATGSQLTDIMMAQDFHDLTGQTVGKVVEVASRIEESLLKLLLDSAPATAAEHGLLDGPVADTTRPDVVANQAQVDDLLESLGF
ncbi:protein phosphatase CheZ [Ramlibacter sp. MMS24-I3-19]|uniref:protein phosphatase CheZ n=1 Tax=Ramlibacter sp. MMS24-I3-19 TaxID=3416606 RepID=UPI003D038BE1